MQAPAVTSAEEVLPAKSKPQAVKQPQHAKHGTLETAWRWRFKRQWRRAQVQPLVADCDDNSDDPWHVGLEMIQVS